MDTGREAVTAGVGREDCVLTALNDSLTHVVRVDLATVRCETEDIWPRAYGFASVRPRAWPSNLLRCWAAWSGQAIPATPRANALLPRRWWVAPLRLFGSKHLVYVQAR